MESPKTTIPLRLELEYMLDQRRLIDGLYRLTVASFGVRHDSNQLLDALGLTAREVLNTRKLREKLRRIAETITTEKLVELKLLLNKQLRRPDQSTIEQWIDEQVIAVQNTIEQWLLTADNEITKARLMSIPIEEMSLGLQLRARQVGVMAERQASAAVLQLNRQLIEQISLQGGSSHYRWLTQRDGRVRPNHEVLDDRIFDWDDPPMGGGTRPDDTGHPGSGYGCRCLPVPFEGPVSL